MMGFPEHFKKRYLMLLEAKIIDTYKRYQSRMHFGDMFPLDKNSKLCRCGCGKAKQKQSKYWYWHDKKHQDKALTYYWIIKGDTKVIINLLCPDEFGVCNICKKEERYKFLELDHIREVVNGGGGCELDNYQMLCHECHVTKTTELLRSRTKSKTDILQLKLVV